MRFDNNPIEFPAIPAIGGRKVSDATLTDLEHSNSNLITYGINEGDILIFPDFIWQIELKKREIRPGGESYEYLLKVIRNGRGSWLSVCALNRKDHKNKPMHPVSEYLIECSNYAECVLAVLGKTIVAKKMVDYTRYKIENGIQTHEVEYSKTAYLEFLED